MNKNLFLTIFSLLGLAYMSDLHATKLLGVFNNLTPIGKIKAPRVEIVNDPVNITSSEYISPTASGTIHALDISLPAYINITYDETINKGQPYTIKVEDTEKTGNCPGNKTIVNVGVKDLPDTLKSVCVSKAVSDILGTRADRWQNVLLAVGNNPKYSPGAAKGSEGEFPFIFGLNAWSSSKEPWHRDKISATSDKQTAVKFDTPLRVIQGHTAFGGGSIPRLGFGSLEHIYNDSPYVLLMERSSLDKKFAGYNFREIVPPLSAVPFGMIWIPKIAATDKDAQQKSTLYIHAMGAPTAGPRVPPPPTAFEYISKAGTGEIGASPVSTDEIEDFVKSLSASNPDQTAEILGEETLDKLISNNYKQYFIGKYYYKVYSVIEDKHIYVERCKLGTDECTLVKSYPYDAVTAYGDPNYFKLVVKKDANYGVTIDITQISKEL